MRPPYRPTDDRNSIPDNTLQLQQSRPRPVGGAPTPGGCAGLPDRALPPVRGIPVVSPAARGGLSAVGGSLRSRRRNEWKPVRRSRLACGARATPGRSRSPKVAGYTSQVARRRLQVAARQVGWVAHGAAGVWLERMVGCSSFPRSSARPSAPLHRFVPRASRVVLGLRRAGSVPGRPHPTPTPFHSDGRVLGADRPTPVAPLRQWARGRSPFEAHQFLAAMSS